MQLKDWRQKNGLSQEEVAARLKISRSLVGAIERNEKKLSLKTAARIERITGEVQAIHLVEVPEGYELRRKDEYYCGGRK